MKHIAYLFALAAVVLSVYSCDWICPKGSVVRQERVIDSRFDTISIGSGLTVYITRDSVDRIEVETNENLQSYIQTRVDNGNLVVSMKDSTKIIGIPTINVYVSASSLSAINCSESSKADMSGGSHIHITINDSHIETWGGSRIRFKENGSVIVNAIEGSTVVRK